MGREEEMFRESMNAGGEDGRHEVHGDKRSDRTKQSQKHGNGADRSRTRQILSSEFVERCASAYSRHVSWYPSLR